MTMNAIQEFSLISVDYKFQIPKTIPIEQPHSRGIDRQRSGSADYTARTSRELSPVMKKRWFESDSIASVNLESSLKIFHEDERSMPRVSSRMRIFDTEKGFLGRRASLMKKSWAHGLASRRNTVG